VIKLRQLRPGDRVALVAPASSFAREEVAPGVAELARLGLEAVYDESLFAKDRFVAGSAAVRAAAIERAWADPSIAGLVAMRGGYGSAQLLPLLDPALMRAARKALIGYSDVTALLAFYQLHGLTAIHGPMVDRRLSRGIVAYDEGSFRRVLMADAPAGEFRPEGIEVLRGGSAAGILAGGTLTQLTASLGTPWAFAAAPGSVLFIEDIGERPYRIHRMLTQLQQAGVFGRASALVFGEFPGCDEPGGSHPIRDILEEFAAGFGGPVLFGYPSGHTAGPTWTLPLGVRAEVSTGATPGITVTEAAVA
jgi:muramoyltetrapeptide carboxypeptidase